MRDQATDNVGQTIRVGDRVVYVSGNRHLRMTRTTVVGFTDASVRVEPNGRCVTAGRLIKIEDQS